MPFLALDFWTMLMGHFWPFLIVPIFLTIRASQMNQDIGKEEQISLSVPFPLAVSEKSCCLGATLLYEGFVSRS